MVQERLCNLKINKYEMWNKLDLYKSTITIFPKDQKSGAYDAQDVSVKTRMKNKMINYLITSINDPTLDLNMALKTMGE